MQIPVDIEALDGFDRLGWISRPTPVHCSPGIAKKIGAADFWVKRDDLTEPLFGSSKTRKLDFLLAEQRFVDASTLASMGAIGSGSLVAIASAAEALNKSFHAYMFWEPLSHGVEHNLHHIVNRAERVFFIKSRFGLSMMNPRLLLGATIKGAAVIPPGATTPRSTIGIVRGAWELAQQVREGLCPEPDVVVVPHGTGGMVAGLSVGLALAGLKSTVLAVSAVEWALSPPIVNRYLVGKVIKELRGGGLSIPDDFRPAEVSFDYARVGPGYGHATAASNAATDILVSEGIPAEPVYSGKAMAALIADPTKERKIVLFWVTPRRYAALQPLNKPLPRALKGLLEP